MWATLRFVWTFTSLARRRRKTPEAMRLVQERRFRRMLRYAVKHSPFYQRLYRGVNLETCRPTDLPTLNKRVLMSHFEEIVTDRRIKLAELSRFLEDTSNLGKYYLDKYVACHTSGSQGQPAIIVQDRQAMEMAFAAQMARGNALPKTPAEILRILFRKKRLAVVTLRRGFYPSGAAFEYMPPAMLTFTDVLRLSQTDGMEHVVERLNEFRPDFLTAYASVLEMLAREEQAGRLKLRQAGCLKQLTNMSEPLPENSRALLSKVFGVQVVDNYAMAECMALSNGCTRFTGSHINMDQALLEVADDENRPVPHGKTGSKVLVTNLYNLVQPLIRYEVGDVLTIAAERCPCGSSLDLISSIQGRTKDKFWIQVGSEYREVLPYVFMAPLLHCLDLAEYQIIQVERNTFVIKATAVVPGQLDMARLQRVMIEGLRAEGLDETIQLKYEVVENIPADPRSGKVKRMFSHVGPPAEKMGLDADLPVQQAA